jgi:hypothetical protein
MTIAGFHAGHEMIVEMQVRAADGATCDLDNIPKVTLAYLDRERAAA